MDRVRFIKKCDESTLTHACALLSRATHRSALDAQHVRRLVVLRERNLGVARDEAYDSLALYPANAGTFRVFQTIDDVVVGILPVAVSHQAVQSVVLTRGFVVARRGVCHRKLRGRYQACRLGELGRKEER